MDSQSQDRNLPASERKLRKAREDGQASRSQDLGHLALLGSAAALAFALAPQAYEHLHGILQQQLHFDAEALRWPGTALERLQDATLTGLGLSAVFGLSVALMVVLAVVLTGGWVFSTKPITPDLSRINPLQGLRNLFSKKQWFALSKTVVLTVVLFTVAGLFLASGMAPLTALLRQPAAPALAHLGQWLAGGMGLLLLVVLLAALIDVPLQRYLHRDQLKMSHQEVKQESKETDGNPLLKSRQRQRQREMAQKASVTAVPKADFVVMNPTHFAVAVRYDDKSMSAPQVVSKGADLLALRIRDLAKQHGVPVLQSPMLARALYAHGELQQDIPAALFTAVAQVLAYVYRLKAALAGLGPTPTDIPQPEVPVELDPLHGRTAATAP